MMLCKIVANSWKNKVIILWLMLMNCVQSISHVKEEKNKAVFNAKLFFLIFHCCFHVHVFRNHSMGLVCFNRYDDYDYGEVNQLLERGLKLYIKAVACYPDSTKNRLCPLPLVSLKASEKVGIRFYLMMLFIPQCCWVLKSNWSDVDLMFYNRHSVSSEGCSFKLQIILMCSF